MAFNFNASLDLPNISPEAKIILAVMGGGVLAAASVYGIAKTEFGKRFFKKTEGEQPGPDASTTEAPAADSADAGTTPPPGANDTTGPQPAAA